MDTSRIAVVAAATSLLAWFAKAVAVGVAGGPGLSPAESPLFLVGLVAAVVAVVALALTVSRGRPRLVRAAAIVAGFVTVVAVVAVVQWVIQRVQPADPAWVWAEINLWVVGALVLGLAAALLHRSRQPSDVVPTPQSS